MNATGFEIRNATVEDIPEIQEITHAAFLKYVELAGIEGDIPALTESAEDVKNDIENHMVLVAYINGKVVGSVRVKRLSDDTAYLYRFGVHPNFQNLGIGKALMNLVDINMKVRGFKQLQLHTGAKIKPLVIFYYGRGFYIHSTNADRGYIRALLCKEYK